MANDDEISAMTIIAAALEPLDAAAQKRALAWASSRFGGQGPQLGVSPPEQPSSAVGERYDSAYSPGFESFAEFFSEAGPKTEKEKALLGGYWVQVVGGQSAFAAQSLNAELKDLGHGIGNITEALTALKNERPALALQLKKSGSSRQARKIYKLTQEGIRRVREMLSNNRDE